MVMHHCTVSCCRVSNLTVKPNQPVSQPAHHGVSKTAAIVSGPASSNQPLQATAPLTAAARQLRIAPTAVTSTADAATVSATARQAGAAPTSSSFTAHAAAPNRASGKAGAGATAAAANQSDQSQSFAPSLLGRRAAVKSAIQGRQHTDQSGTELASPAAATLGQQLETVVEAGDEAVEESEGQHLQEQLLPEVYSQDPDPADVGTIDANNGLLGNVYGASQQDPLSESTSMHQQHRPQHTSAAASHTALNSDATGYAQHSTASQGSPHRVAAASRQPHPPAQSGAAPASAHDIAGSHRQTAAAGSQQNSAVWTSTASADDPAADAHGIAQPHRQTAARSRQQATGAGTPSPAVDDRVSVGGQASSDVMQELQASLVQSLTSTVEGAVAQMRYEQPTSVHAIDQLCKLCVRAQSG